MIARGIRNNNPANIRRGSNWKGLKLAQTDKEFCQFVSMYYGIRALIIVLRTYVTVHGLHTIRQIISRWAPPEDKNNTDKYVEYVEKKLWNDLHEKDVYLTVEDFTPKQYKRLFVICQAMCMMESHYFLKEEEFIHVIRTMR